MRPPGVSLDLDEPDTVRRWVTDGVRRLPLTYGLGRVVISLIAEAQEELGRDCTPAECQQLADVVTCAWCGVLTTALERQQRRIAQLEEQIVTQEHDKELPT